MSKFIRHLKRCSKIVRTWPKWKQNILGSAEVGSVMKAIMRDNLVERYERALPGELEAAENSNEVIEFLVSIESKEVDLVFTCDDAFEKNDNNIWLPDSLWDEK